MLLIYDTSLAYNNEKAFTIYDFLHFSGAIFMKDRNR